MSTDKDNNNKDKKIHLKKKDMIIATIIIDQTSSLLYKIEFNNSDPDDAFMTLLYNALTNRRSLSSQDKFSNFEIGMNDQQLYIGLTLLSLKYTNNNIILNFLNFYPSGILIDNYFEAEKPDYNAFIEKFEMNLPKYENKLVITPLVLNSHFSLLLFYNKKIFILDFGLLHCTDDNKMQKRHNFYNIEKKMNEQISIYKDFDVDNDIENEIYTLIDSKISEEELKDKLKNLINNNDEILLELIKKYHSLENELNEFKEIEKKTSRGDPLIFQNESLSQNIQVINFYKIQGEQTCSYYCLAAYKCIITNNYTINDIVTLCTNCIFQVKVSKIILEDFFNDQQNIFKINENMSSNDYKIFNKNENTIGVKKNIKNIKIEQRKDMIELDKTELIDIINIENMLIKNGYKLVVQSDTHN